MDKYRGLFDEAERLYRRALATHTDRGPAGRADVAVVPHNLGGLAHEHGDHAAAEAWARHGIPVRE